MALHSEQSSRNKYQVSVVKKRNDELRAFAASHGLSNVYKSLSGATEHISGSYKGRTLIELVQNGYDAHPQDKGDGEIAIYFDSTENAFGCLYVANRGSGFKERNFVGLCDIARTPKIVNQGIGNKGIGFRSVLQICDFPEIYSVDGTGKKSNEFAGYCFSFPNDEFLRDLLAQTKHAELATDIVKAIPRLMLPVAITEQSERVRSFAQKGFATVIRMPLKSEASNKEVLEQISQLRDHELPIQLFLERISLIQLVIANGESNPESEEPNTYNLPRHTIEKWHVDEIEFQRVRIEDNLEYLLARSEIPDHLFQPILLAGINSDQLPDSWRDWENPADVSVAVPLGRDEGEGRLYNFLPMESSAPSPFGGHLNAPFLCDIDRKRLVDKVDLNKFLLDQSASLCLQAARYLQGNRPDLARTAVVDLTMWTGEHTEIIDRASKSTCDSALLDLDLIPLQSASSKPSWAKLTDISIWPAKLADMQIMKPQLLARYADAWIADINLGEHRLNRIEEVAYDHEIKNLDPPGKILAKWAEKIADHMVNTNASVKRWDRFYVDLISIFKDDVESLRNRKILLTADSKLAPTMAEPPIDEEGSQARRHRTRRAIFFPRLAKENVSQQSKEQEGDEEFEVEDDNSLALKGLLGNLRNRIRLLHPLLSCARKNDDTGVREFLIFHKLANRYQTNDIQRLLGNLTDDPGKGKDPTNRRIQALTFAFELSNRGKNIAELGEMRFRVPNYRGEWIQARKAFLGNGWPETHGDILSSLVEAAKSSSSELDAVGDMMLPSFQKWPISVGTPSEWARFLKAIRVSDILRPLNARKQGPLKTHGSGLAYELSRRCKLSEPLAKLWNNDILALSKVIKNPQTNYTIRGPVPVLPGLSDYDLLSLEAKRLYAIELLHLIQENSDQLLQITLFRPDHTLEPNLQHWPSPLFSFLRSARWLPINSRDESDGLSRPSDTWFAPRTAGQFRPDFINSISSNVRVILEQSESLHKMLQENFGLNVINSPKSAGAQIAMLGKIAADSLVPRSDINVFDELYSHAWADLNKDTSALDDALNIRPFYLAVRCESGITGYLLAPSAQHDEVVDTDSGSTSESVQTVYLSDDQLPTTQNLLKELGYPVFDFNFSRRDQLAHRLAQEFSDLTLASDVNLVTYADGAVVVPSDSDEYLVGSNRRWLVDAIILISSLAAPFLVPDVGAREKMRANLERLRYHLVDHIEIDIGTERRPLPKFTQGSLLIRDASNSLIVQESPDKELSWDVLRNMAHSISEAIDEPRYLPTALSSAFSQLAARHRQEILAMPSNEDYQAVCHAGEAAVHEAQQGLRHALDHLAEMAIPAIYCLASEKIAHEFQGAISKIDSESEFEEVVERYGQEQVFSADKLVLACRTAYEINDVRVALEIPLLAFNAALTSLGASYKVLNFGEDHKIAYRSFCAKHKEATMNALRAANLARHDNGVELTTYVQARSREDLLPDPTWEERYDTLPEDVMLAALNTWLSNHGANAIGQDELVDGLGFEQVRSQNMEQLRQLVLTGWPAINAWCHANTVMVPSVWLHRDGSTDEIIDIFQENGWLDFRLLHQPNFIRRLEKIEAWPDGMPETLGADALGLTAKSITAEQDAAKIEKDKERRRANTIEVGELQISIDQPDLPDKLNQIIEELSTNKALWATSSRNQKLPEIDPSGKNSSAGGQGGSAGSGRKQAPEGQRQAIGLVGEKIAYEWLRRKYPNLVNEDCWVSKNRELALQAGPGDDNLGYDFVVHRSTTAYYYEVKATSGEECFFRLGPTEVESAIKFSKDGQHKFRILFIQWATNPKQVRIFQLPNPYSDQGRNCYRQVTKGELGLQFSLPPT